MVPSVETLEKWAHALDVKLYQPLHSAFENFGYKDSWHRENLHDLWGSEGKDARFLDRMRAYVRDHGHEGLLR